LTLKTCRARKCEQSWFLRERRVVLNIETRCDGASCKGLNKLRTDLQRPCSVRRHVTGLSSTIAEFGGERLELVRQVVPNLSRVGVLALATNPFTRPFLSDMNTAAGNGRSPRLFVGASLQKLIAVRNDGDARRVLGLGSLPEQRSWGAQTKWRWAISATGLKHRRSCATCSD